MAQFVLLMKLTASGASDIDSLSQHREVVEGIVANLHGDVREFLYTLGTYDVVAIMELEDDEAAACLALRIAGAGKYTTTTMRAFTTDEAVQSLGKK